MTRHILNALWSLPILLLLILALGLAPDRF